MLLHEERLAGVNADLQAVIRRAHTYLDFHVQVQEGVRTAERQAQLVAAGASRTLNSRHITGHAVDLTSAVDIDRDGKIEIEELYSWALSFKIAMVMKKAAAELNIPIVWGGCWDRLLAELRDPETASADYVVRVRKTGRRPFVDGPHYELARSKYP